MHSTPLNFRDYIDEVRAEAAEHLRALDTQLLQLERDPTNVAPIRQMFLSAHTIKGSAAMVDLTEVSTLAHAVEEVLAWLRDERRRLDTATADLLFLSLDTLRALVERSQPDETLPDLPTADLVAQLHRCAGHDPSAAEEGEGKRATPRAAEAEKARQPTAERPRVLLVEESPTVRMLETMLLTDAGFEVEALGDGGRALELALAHPYQLLVTGVETRGLRGPALAAALRATPAGRGLPIIIMSSEDDEAARRDAAEADVQAYIRKGSFGRQRLVETARSLADAWGVYQYAPTTPPGGGAQSR
jgi:chemotaxis protein histidine kinase CheA